MKVSAQHLKCWIFVHVCFAGEKREEGEGGIQFDDEDEKEQWEEDQRVST